MSELLVSVTRNDGNKIDSSVFVQRAVVVPDSEKLKF